MYFFRFCRPYTNAGDIAREEKCNQLAHAIIGRAQTSSKECEEIEMRKVLAITALTLAGSFGMTACHNGNSASSPGPTSPAGSVYPADAQNSIVSDCEQNNGEPASYCQCNLNWLEANIPYSMFAQTPATFEEQADAYASC